ncbi:LysR family transcriptional regulator [Lysinibacter cavernae]|uniref:DNA-binding transcriptional LysR family regulator n=1 Tax=Lysinibacter cavernae TaxID=1640652 RepID=A0A7X5R266_9MICO|nr:LysR family transcriptional regulator [Lysinibacter cavernae]NIH54299.1 DNA-binding transcriptional LysR family regulator [Lysinibacter cavernae]
MNIELKQLRALVAVADTESFTDAALELDTSQATVSRLVAALEASLGTRLIRRTTREVTPTATGTRALLLARRILAEVEDLESLGAAGNDHLRVGFAWSAIGKHTVAFQKNWAAAHPATELTLFSTNTPTSGLAEGKCDIAVVRQAVDERKFATAVVGVELRYCVMAADDEWARRRSIRLAEIAERVIAADRRTGTTTAALWPEDAQPQGIRYTANVDDWLALIASGAAVGITSEATMHQYRRPGIVYRLVKDAPPIAVSVAWWKDDPHPMHRAVTNLLTALYRS